MHSKILKKKRKKHIFNLFSFVLKLKDSKQKYPVVNGAHIIHDFNISNDMNYDFIYFHLQ